MIKHRYRCHLFHEKWSDVVVSNLGIRLLFFPLLPQIIRSQIVTLKMKESLRSQFVTLKTNKGGRMYLPYDFTKQGTMWFYFKANRVIISMDRISWLQWILRRREKNWIYNIFSCFIVISLSFHDPVGFWTLPKLK